MPSFTIGLDLGQVRDPSVLAVVERVLARPPRAPESFTDMEEQERRLVDHHFVRHLQRFEIGTSYTAIVDESARLLDRPEIRGNTALRFDATGVGRGIADMFRDAYRDGRLGDRWPEPVTLTGGRESSGLNVAKVDLVGALQRILQEHRLHVPEALPGADKLRQELTDFTAKISAAGRDAFEAATEAAHDDHVVAVGLAVVRRSSAGWPRLMSDNGTIIDDPESY